VTRGGLVRLLRGLEDGNLLLLCRIFSPQKLTTRQMHDEHFNRIKK